MTKKFKKFLASAVAIISLTTGMIGLSAFATYNGFSFSIERGTSGFSSNSAQKTVSHNTSQDYAIVVPASGNVSSTMCYLSVYNSSKNTAYSSSYRISSLNTFHIPYSRNLTVNNNYYLKAEAGYYGVELSGDWEP